MGVMGGEVAENAFMTTLANEEACRLLPLPLAEPRPPPPTHTSQPNPAHTITGKGIFRIRRTPLTSSSHGQSVRNEGREGVMKKKTTNSPAMENPCPCLPHCRKQCGGGGALGA